MGLRHIGYIELPAHTGQGGFDHAAVDQGRSLLYVAHTANDAIDVIDTGAGRYMRSITGLTGVAGALVAETARLVFTSNRGENTIGILASDPEKLTKVPVGIRPNGLAFDPERGVLLSANVGDPNVPGSPSVTLVEVSNGRALITVPMPGRTRWTVFDPSQHVFFVNVADPSVIGVLDVTRLDQVARFVDVPARGPHGLDLDHARQRLYCACDDGMLVVLDSTSGSVIGSVGLSGPPDVVFLNPTLSRLYVAVGDPGVIDVVDVAALERAEVIATERGAHTIGFDASTSRVFAFCPQSHRASVFVDRS